MTVKGRADSLTWLCVLMAGVAMGQVCLTDPDCTSFCASSCTCSANNCINCVPANVGQPCVPLTGPPSTCDASGKCPTTTSAPTTLAPSLPPTTRSPSASPSARPTGAPSGSPTNAPSPVPSPVPSLAPSFSPSRAPSVSPTPAPTTSVDYVVQENTVVPGNATVRSLAVASNATLVVLGTATISGPLTVTLAEKPASGSAVTLVVLEAGKLRGNFSAISAVTSEPLAECETLSAVGAPQTRPNTVAVTVSLTSSCDALSIGAIAGIAAGCVVAVVGGALFLAWVAKRRKERWTQAANADIARKRAESMKKAYSSQNL